MDGSLRQYARHRGESLKAVQKAITSRRISGPIRGRLDFAKADAEWTRNTAPRVSAGRTAPRASTGRATKPGSNGDALNYATARAIREQFAARLAKLDYDERIGKLVDRAKVEAAAFDVYRGLRDQLLTIPDRVAALVAAESDQGKVRNILDAELRARLNDFADKAGGTQQQLPVAG